MNTEPSHFLIFLIIGVVAILVFIFIYYNGETPSESNISTSKNKEDLLQKIEPEKLNRRLEELFGGDRETRIKNYNIAGLNELIEGYQAFKTQNDYSLMEFTLKNINDDLRIEFGYDGEEITNDNIDLLERIIKIM